MAKINSKDTPMSKIVRLDANEVLSSVGEFNSNKFAHNVAFDGTFMLVIGGVDQQATEKCSFDGDQVICTEQSPVLEAYQEYPELFMVPPTFCVKNENNL